MRKLYTTILLSAIAFSFIQCGGKQNTPQNQFTKADSLADFYLRLQDTLHRHWNIMINDDNQKIRAMHHLLHEIMVTHTGDPDVHKSYEERLDQLTRMRYTQKSMSNNDVVAEYDLATNSLIQELVAAAESKREYAYNVTLQKMVDNILTADQRMVNYRFQYDSMVRIYNRFLDKNQKHLLEANLSPEKKPVFQMISSD